MTDIEKRAREIGREPAFPQSEFSQQDKWDQGLTKFQEFARTAMQGLLGNPKMKRTASELDIAELALMQSDALCLALAEREASDD